MIPWKRTKDLKSSVESVLYCFSHTSATLIRFCPMLIEFVAYEIAPNTKCTGTKVKFLHITLWLVQRDQLSQRQLSHIFKHSLNLTQIGG